MSYSSCLARIGEIRGMIGRADTAASVGTSGVAWTGAVRALDSGSPFAGVLETIANPGAASTSSSASEASVVLPVGMRQSSSGVLLGPSYNIPGELVQESASDALARFDAVSASIPYAAQIRQAALAAGIDPLLLTSLASTESGFDATAVSRCGAQGLTQLMPGTARGLGVTDSFDPLQNLSGGATYLAQQLRTFGRVDLALAAYNQGPGAVSRAGGVPNGTWSYVGSILTTWARYESRTR